MSLEVQHTNRTETEPQSNASQEDLKKYTFLNLLAPPPPPFFI